MKTIILLVAILAILQSKEIYNPKTSYVTPITSLNFKQQVQKIREATNYVSIVQFYKYDDGFSQGFSKKFDQWTDDYRGLFRIGSVDCDNEAEICKKEGIDTYPTFRIYLPEPYPHIDLKGETTIQDIQKKAAKQLYSKNVIEVTNTNASTFLSESPTVPKVLLFTKSEKGIPMIYKGLSVSFEGKLFFGIVRSSDQILVDKYRVKDFPKILVIKTGEKKPFAYSGEIKFNPIHDFLNVYSETFVPGGGSTQDTSASKQWLTEIVPELHQKSANDICLKTDNTLCVIHFGEGKPSQDTMQVLKDLNVSYDRKIDRGSQFKFMWIDTSIEKEWAQAFKHEENNTVYILNPGKRKRYVKHEGEVTFSSLKQSIEKINGGDARFVKVNLPSQFAFRKE